MSTTGGRLDQSLIWTGAVVAAAATIATIGFDTVFADRGFLALSAAGAVLGAGVGLFSRHRRLLTGEMMALATIVPILAGPALVRSTDFFRGLVFGWTEILSATPPIDPTAELLAVPFIAAYLGAVLGVELAAVAKAPGLAILGPISSAVLTALFSGQSSSGSMIVGVTLVVGLLVLVGLHHQSHSVTQRSASSGAKSVQARVAGLAFPALALLAVGVVAPVAADVATDRGEDRVNLRDLQVPPWDPLALPSPLTQLKAGLKTDATSSPLFVVRGDTPTLRWRTSALPSFNGVIWSVADRQGEADFIPVDSKLPRIVSEPTMGDRSSTTHEVEVVGPLGHWLPTAGIPTQLNFDGDVDARLNPANGTIGVPRALTPGVRYTITSVPFVDLTDSELAALSFLPDNASADLTALPPTIRTLAADFTTGIAQLSGRRATAIRDNLALGSYDLDVAPGHAFGRIAEFLSAAQQAGADNEDGLRQLAGFEEQYTASAAVLMRLSDIPTRVAVGYLIPEDRWVGGEAEIFASDINAWVEVQVEDGWMPVDVTPNRSRDPQESDKGTDEQGVPIADPPKEPPAPDEQASPEIIDPTPEPTPPPDEDTVEQVVVSRRIRPAVVATVSVLTPLLLFAALGLGVLGLKAWRRRQRRSAAEPSAQIAGAWAELRDRIEEAGGAAPRRATPSEAAIAWRVLPGLEEPEAAGRLQRLARQVSEAAFHPVPPSPESAGDAWRTYDELAALLDNSATKRSRVRRSIDPRPLVEQGSPRS